MLHLGYLIPRKVNKESGPSTLVLVVMTCLNVLRDVMLGFMCVLLDWQMDERQAVVNVENKDNRTWFLKLLEEELGCSKGNGLTLMSDQHKGLIEAVKDVIPNAEHMQCARHIYKNFKKQYPGLEYRQLLWATSKASCPQLFNKIIDKIKSANPNAHKYLMDKNPKTWSKAFFEVDRGCEAIENGFTECFNSVIVNVRHKPLLTMLEAIRVIVLERMNKMREIINEGKRTCSYRMWQLSGLPYVHATKSMYSNVLPSKPRKMPGRPRKKRIRAIGASRTRGGAIGSRGRGGAAGSRGGASGSIGRGAGGPGGASRSRGRGTDGSRGGTSGSIGRGASGSKTKHVLTARTQKRQGKKKVGTFGFAKWLGFQDKPEHAQAEPQQTQHEQTQVKDQVEQTEDQAEIDLTKLEQTQKPT
uniref:Zinc finger PMZ-type domain-containing protein n=1 Tax=Tanacetum cinerariifolium TaxID=118510 RepID=A0A6L2L4G8_TANCI|nr:hypothetical protein [Tanacetum cinerariifolium]